MKQEYVFIEKYDLEVGQRFERWTISSDKLIQHSGRKQVQVTCVCGNSGIVRHDRLKSGKTLGCKSCQKMTNYPDTRVSRALHYEGLRVVFLSKIRHGCKRREGYKSIEVNITIEELYRKLVEQDFKCALTGEELNVLHLNPYDSNASIDRIDSDGNYDFDNIQWVLKNLNMMKNSFSQKYFIDMCRKVANKYDNHEPSLKNNIKVLRKVQRLGVEKLNQ